MSTPRFVFDVPTSPYATPSAPPPAPLAPRAGWWLRAGYLFAGLLTVGVVLAALNPRFGFHNAPAGFDPRRWPWEVLFPEGAPFRWTREVAWVCALGGSSLALLVAAFLTSARARAFLAILASAALGAALLPAPADNDLLPACGMNAMLALLLATAAAANRRPSAPGSLRWAGIAMLVLGALLFLPLPDRPMDAGPPVDASGYRAEGPGTYEAVVDLVRQVTADDPPEVGRAPDGSPMKADLRYLLDQLGGMVPQLAWCLAFVVGLLLLLRLGRPWSPWVLGLALLAAVLLPPALNALGEVREAGLGVPDAPLSTREVFDVAALGASKSLLVLERLMLIPLALGVLDLLRARRTAA